MTHPGPLLIDYVDDTLDASARAAIDTHLQTCAACLADVRLARAGKRAAGSMPEPDVPAGVANAAIAEATRLASRRHPEVTSIDASPRRRPNTQRWVGLVAAAAVVIGVALLAPNLGGNPGSPMDHAASAPGAESEASSPAPAAPHRVLANGQDYTSTTLTDATRSAQQVLAASSTSGAQYGMTADSAAFAPFNGTPTSTPLSTAVSCLHHAFETADGKLVRVVLATYNGRSAYFGIYLVHPGRSGELRIDVASSDDCQILTQSSAKL